MSRAPQRNDPGLHGLRTRRAESRRTADRWISGHGTPDRRHGAQRGDERAGDHDVSRPAGARRPTPRSSGLRQRAGAQPVAPHDGVGGRTRRSPTCWRSRSRRSPRRLAIRASPPAGTWRRRSRRCWHSSPPAPTPRRCASPPSEELRRVLVGSAVAATFMGAAVLLLTDVSGAGDAIVIQWAGAAALVCAARARLLRAGSAPVRATRADGTHADRRRGSRRASDGEAACSRTARSACCRSGSSTRTR